MIKLALAFVLLAACGTSDDTDAVAMLQTEQPSITRVEFTTASSIPQNAPPDVIANATGDAAQAIYAATLALPLAPAGPESCPIDFGVTYTLTFYGTQDALVAGTIQPGGCQIATMAATIATASLSMNGDYWATLASDLGIEEAEIYPYVPAN